MIFLTSLIGFIHNTVWLVVSLNPLLFALRFLTGYATDQRSSTQKPAKFLNIPGILEITSCRYRVRNLTKALE